MRSVNIFILALGAVLLARPAMAGELGPYRLLVTPAIEYEAAYTDNLQRTDDGDFSHIISPELVLDFTTERSQLTLGARYRKYIHHDHSEYNRDTQHYTLFARHMVTERLTLFLDGNLDKDYSLSTVEEELGTTALKTARTRWGVSPRFQYLLTERDVLSGYYSHSSTEYEDRYVDNTGQSVGLQWDHALTERFTTHLYSSYGWTHSVFDDEQGTGDTRTLNVGGGFDYLINELWTLSVLVGRSFTSSSLDLVTREDDQSGTGFSATVRLGWKLERSFGNVTYSRDTTVGLGGQDYDRDRISFFHSYGISERQRFEFSAGLTHTKSDDFVDEVSENTYWSVHPRYWYDINEDFRMWIGYQHGDSLNEVTNDSNSWNRIYLKLRYEFPEEY